MKKPASHRRWQADPLSFQRLLNKLQPFSEPERLRLELPIRLSFEALRTGQGSESDFHDLAAAINVTMIRAETAGAEAEQAAIAAHDALMRVWRRWQRASKWQFCGSDLADIEDGIGLHEQFIVLSTPQQMINAGNEAIRRGAVGEVVV